MSAPEDTTRRLGKRLHRALEIFSGSYDLDTVKKAMGWVTDDDALAKLASARTRTDDAWELEMLDEVEGALERALPRVSESGGIRSGAGAPGEAAERREEVRSDDAGVDSNDARKRAKAETAAGAARESKQQAQDPAPPSVVKSRDWQVDGGSPAPRDAGKSQEREAHGARLDWKQVQRGLKQFEATGDTAPALTALGVAQGRDPLLAVQQALAEAQEPWERDLLEDVGFVLMGHPVTVASETALQRIELQVTERFGPLAQKCVPSIRKLTEMILGVEPSTPEAAIVAAIGLEARKAVATCIPVSKGSAGGQTQFYSTECPECGGEKGGQGSVVCSCIKEGRYGCHKCQYKGRRPCRCSFEINIPGGVQDGMIVGGKRPADGSDILAWVTIR